MHPPIPQGDAKPFRGLPGWRGFFPWSLTPACFDLQERCLLPGGGGKSEKLPCYKTHR